MRIFVPRAVVLIAFAVVSFGFAPERALANIITMDATDSGWYDSSGNHDATNKNYIAGFASPNYYNDYFVFDLTSIQDPIFAAEVKLYMPTVNSDGGAGYFGPGSVFSLYHVQAPVSAVMQSQSGLSGQIIYADLGSGVVLGSSFVSAADNGTLLSIQFNTDGIAALNAAIGGQIAIGGSLATLGSTDQYAFGWSGETSTRQVIVATVPEPVMFIQLGVGLSVFMMVHTHRRRQTRTV